VRDDPRVDVRERCNVRHLTQEAIGGPVDLVVADLSFISLTAVLAALLAVAAPRAPLVLLVKPQFEAGRAEVSRGHGVVRDPEVRRAVRSRIDDALRAGGATIMGWMESPLRGADGNVELFVHALAPAAPVGPVEGDVVEGEAIP
jgi:23S rRNA (cytidine1920-2'-O)/16S rRNA (cytidine1409-2'-O)-methyltransferase